MALPRRLGDRQGLPPARERSPASGAIGFLGYATCASSLRARASSSCSRVLGAALGPEPLGLPLGLGRSASAPPSRYGRHQFLSGDSLAIPKRAIASGFDMPPSTTARAAATLVS